MKKPKITKRTLRSLALNATERLQLSLFVANNADWVAHHAIPLEVVLCQCLRRQSLELLRLEKVEPHPVYELFLRLGRGKRATKSGIEMAVRQAFAAAGRSVKREFAFAQIKGNRARVDVLVDSWPTRRNHKKKRRQKPFLMGRR